MARGDSPCALLVLIVKYWFQRILSFIKFEKTKEVFMVIQHIQIEKFRGFQNVGFDLGSQLTVISGRNGTQKTTLLGMLSQPFSLRNTNWKDVPLCGGSFDSQFAEKFKLSDKFDKAKEHKWTLSFFDDNESPYTVASMERIKGGPIRFWKAGSRGKGTGYKPYPVIFLSLSRLFPIGEIEQLDAEKFSPSQEEIQFCTDWHDKILAVSNTPIIHMDHLTGTNKNTLGARPIMKMKRNVKILFGPSWHCIKNP
jgi:hypothetical protein